ncbi:hypothetical protein GX917_02240 [Candidatus Falkowbacteria bacterium]|jgi:hypothetical protein|nr:hypothetical protein [Candidatus Falkowbacteria bacterium]
MKKHLTTIFSLLALTALLILPYFVFAQTDTDNTISGRLNVVSKIGGYAVEESPDLLSTIGLIINSLLTLLGVIFIIFIIIAGFQWMTAGGNEQKVEKSIDTIKRSVIGLIIILSSWAIWQFIFTALIT